MVSVYPCNVSITFNLKKVKLYKQEEKNEIKLIHQVTRIVFQCSSNKFRLGVSKCNKDVHHIFLYLDPVMGKSNNLLQLLCLSYQ